MSPRYGQHFLSNRHAAERIVESLDLSAGEEVLEIGPGKGMLSGLLLERGARLTAVEIDPPMVEFLTKKFSSNPHFKIIHLDILEYDLDHHVKIIGNLPYNLTSPILRKLSDWNLWDDAVVMVQKEVGNRMCAKVGDRDYGALTVGMNLVAEMSKVFDVSPSSFDPPPKVHSSIVRLHRRPTPLSRDIPATQRVIQAAFQQRRKMILNSLSHGLGLEKDQAEELLKRSGVEPTIRPERLPVETFVKLSEELGKIS